VDNLQLFHELAGPVFPGFGVNWRRIKMPPSLPQHPLPVDFRLKEH
jgi:hypothetical protein